MGSDDGMDESNIDADELDESNSQMRENMSILKIDRGESNAQSLLDKSKAYRGTSIETMDITKETPIV